MNELTPGQVAAIADGLKAEGWNVHEYRRVLRADHEARTIECEHWNGCVRAWERTVHRTSNAPSVMVSNPIWRKALAVIATVLDSDEGGVGDE